MTTPKPMGSMAKMALAVIIGTFVAVWVGVLIKEAMAAPARRQALEAAADAAAAAKRSEAWQRGKEFAGYRLEKFKPVFPESDRALGCGAEGDGDGLYRTWGYLDGHDPLSNAPGRKSWEAVVKPVVGYAGHWQLKSLKVDGETIVQ